LTQRPGDSRRSLRETGSPMRVNEFSDKYFGKQKCAVSQTAIKLIVIHSTEGSTPEGGANTLSTRSDVSAHLCVGQGATYRIVPEHLGACTVREANPWTLNIEQAGFAYWSRRAWLKRVNTIKRAAFWTAWWCKKYKIPRRYRSTKALNAGKLHGWTTHAALARSKWSSSTHTDPGPNYPLFGRVSFAGLLTAYYASIRLRKRPKPRRVA